MTNNYKDLGLNHVEGSWCPICGPDVKVDEDGCCHTCGADAMGDGADLAQSYRAKLLQLAQYECKDCGHFVNQGEMCPVCRAAKMEERFKWMQEDIDKVRQFRTLGGMKCGSGGELGSAVPSVLKYLERHCKAVLGGGSCG